MPDARLGVPAERIKYTIRFIFSNHRIESTVRICPEKYIKFGTDLF